jgi:Erythromycin esterase
VVDASQRFGRSGTYAQHPRSVPLLSLLRPRQFAIIALAYRQAGGCDDGSVRPKIRPTRGPEHQDRNPATREVLLIAQVFVGRDEKREALRLGRAEQRPILELRPPALIGRRDLVCPKGPPERCGGTLIKEDPHATLGGNREASARVLEDRVNLLSRHAREPLQELGDRRPALQVLEQGAHRHTRRAEKPLAADLPGNPFDGRTVVPIEHTGSLPSAGGRREGLGAMGAFLQGGLGTAYRPVAFTFGIGSFNAVRGLTTGGFGALQPHTITTVPSSSLETLFDATRQPRLILDIRRAVGVTAASRLDGQPIDLRFVGAVYAPEAATNYFERALLPADYDAIIWFATTTATVLRPFPP